MAGGGLCDYEEGALNRGPSFHFPEKIDGVSWDRPHFLVASYSVPLWAHSAPFSSLRGSGLLSSVCGRSPSRLLLLSRLPISTQHCSVSLSTLLQSKGGGWFTINYYRKDPPFCLWRFLPPRPPARFEMPTTRGKMSVNARDW